MLAFLKSSGFGFSSGLFLGMTGIEVAKSVSLWLGLGTAIFGFVTAVIILAYWGIKGYMLWKDFDKWRKSQN